MVKKKRPEALKNPKSSPTQARMAQNDTNSQVAHVQAITNGAKYDLLTGSSLEVGQSTIAGVPYHQPTSATDGAPREQEDFASLRAAARLRRRDLVDDEPLSRAKMWDPVKDCSDPNTIQADLPGFLPAGQNSHEQAMDPMMAGVRSYFDESTYGHAQDNPQAFMISGTRVAPQSMALGYQENASTGPHRFQAGHPYDQLQRRHQQQSGYGNASILPPHPQESSRRNEQQSLDSIARGAPLTDIQARQTGHLCSQSQGSGLQFTGLESRMPASTAPLLLAHHRENLNNSDFYLSSTMSSNLPRRSELDSQQARRLQGQSPFKTANVSEARSMARYAETMEQHSNYTDAIRAYKAACDLFQEVIIMSCSRQERTECNNARNIYQARFDELLRGTAATQRNTPCFQDDQPEDDGPGRGKPQYSLYEDWTLCHKEKEGLSWQEVAETPLFKGKRQHRSLSQRKHTIVKMGPKSDEAEKPWTEEEDRKLCNLGDAGKTLGDIHRKFRSRNAQRCLNRYFHLKGYDTTCIGRTHASHQDPLQYSQKTQKTYDSSVLERNREYRFHSGISVIDSIPHPRTMGTVLQQSPQTSAHANQDVPSVFPLRRQISETSSEAVRLSQAAQLTHQESAARQDADMAGQDAATDRQEATMTQQDAAEAHTYSTTPLNSAASTSRQQKLAAPAPTLAHSRAEGSRSMSAQGKLPNALGPSSGNAFDDPSSPEVAGNEDTDWQFTSRCQRRAPSSSPSASTANSLTDSTPATSAANSPTTPSPPPETHESSDTQKAAANRVGKSRRSAHLE